MRFPSDIKFDVIFGSAFLSSQLLVLLGGLEARGQVFAIATTNRPGDIDPAVIFERHLSETRVGAGGNAGRLAAETPGFSGADVARALPTGGPPLHQRSRP